MRWATWIVFLDLVAVVVAGCISRPYADYLRPWAEYPDADYFAAVLDEFTVPASWVRQETDLWGPDRKYSCDPATDPYDLCPRAATTYVADGDPESLLRTVEQVVEAVGFNVDHTPNDCARSLENPSCSVWATRGGDRLWVQTYTFTVFEDRPVYVSITATHR